MSLDRWRFDAASAAIDRAEAALSIRDQITDLAGTVSLVPDPSIEARYQDAGSVAELNVVVEALDQSLSVLGDVAAARDAADEPRDWLTDLGLDGVDPATEAAEAGRAWEAGDLGAASASAIEVTDALAAAPEAGRSTVVLVGSAAAASLMLLIVVLALAGRRRRRAPSQAPATLPGGAWPYATLPPDGPAAEPPGTPPSADAGADPT
jgi:hypothetical protein